MLATSLAGRCRSRSAAARRSCSATHGRSEDAVLPLHEFCHRLLAIFLRLVTFLTRAAFVAPCAVVPSPLPTVCTGGGSRRGRLFFSK